MLIADFDFESDLSSSVGGYTLASAGGSVIDGAYVFEPNQGLSLSGVDWDPANYTIVMAFFLNDTASWRKFLDFKNLSSDDGLYSYGGSLQFFPNSPSGQTDFVAGQTVHVILTRDGSTGETVGYINGQPSISFIDTGDIAVFDAPGNVMTWFIDDTTTNGGEASGGSLDLLRLFDGPLSATDALGEYHFAAIPEPSTWLLLVTGGVIVWLAARRRFSCRRPPPA